MSKLARHAAWAGIWSALLVIPWGSLTAGSAPPTWHLFSGVDVTRSSNFVHQGFVWSPWGHLYEQGWRLRGAATGGTYRYQTGGQGIRGRAISLEVMPGFEWMGPSYGLKLYLGPTIENHVTMPHDPGKDRMGTRGGGKALVEGWARLSDELVVDASASFATPGRSYSGRVAAQIAMSGALVLEPEIMVLGEPGYDELRVGLHAELYRTPRLRLLLGGGWAFARDRDGPYVGVQFKSWRSVD